MIALGVLGRTEVRRPDGDGAAAVVALRPRERALLAALALRAPSPVAADELIWILWGEDAPATARKSLQNNVVRIRSAGGNGLVVTSGAQYRLGPEVVTDVDRAETLVRQARVARRENRWAERLGLVETCADLRRDVPYLDLADIAGVIGERSRIEELLRQVDEDVAEALLVMGRPDEAIARLERLVAEEPYRERRWEQLLVARFLVGNRRTALQVVPAASTALGEIGLAPSERLTRLEGLGLIDDRDGLINVLVGRQRVDQDADGAQIDGAGLVPDEPGTFVGRQLEAQMLDDAFSRSRTDGVVTVLVCGEAGIGKTTLVRRFTDDLARRGVRTAWGSGAANPRVPLAAWVEVVEQLLDDDPRALNRLDPSDRQSIEGLLRRGPGGPGSGPGPSPDGARERLFDALLHLLAGRSDSGPVVVVLDDLHLTPPSTRRLARRLASAGAPVLLIATVRTADPVAAGRVLGGVFPSVPAPGGAAQPAGSANDAMVAAVDLGAADAGPDVFCLGGLGTEEIDTYLRRSAGTDRVGAAALSWVVDQTGGNPLLLRETARVLVNHRALVPGQSFEPPKAMHRASDALLLLRLEGLAANTVAALHAAAVLGPRFRAVDLGRLVGQADWHLAEAAAVGLTVPGSEPGDIEFAHQLLHEAIYRMISEGERLELHEAAAAVLEESDIVADASLDAPAPAAPIFQIARHHLAAASLDPARAVASLRAAAEASLAKFAYEDAVLRFEEAEGVATHYGLAAGLVCELEIGRGEALRQAGDPSCVELLFDAAELADQLGAGNLLAAAALALCRLGPTTASGAADDRAAAVADRALVVVTDVALQAELAGEASLLHSMGGEPERCRSLYEQAEVAAEQLGDPQVLARVLPHAYLALGAPWELERRAAIAERVSALGRSIMDLSTDWEACLLAYSVHLERGDPAVFDVAARIRNISDVLREPTRQWETQWVEAGIAHLRGDLDTAERVIGSSLASVGAVAPSRVVATYGAQILALRIDQGRVGELVTDLRGLIAEQPGLAAWRAALALAAAQSDRSDLALEQLSAFWEAGSLRLPPDFTWTGMAVVLGRAAAVVGTPEMQEDLAAALAPYQGRLAWAGSCSYGLIDTVIGMLLGALGDQEGSEAALHRARALADRLGAEVFGAEVDRLRAATSAPGGS